MKKILLATLDFYPKTGGVANYYLNLCKGLGKQAVVLTSKAGAKDKFDFKVIRKNILSKMIWPKWLRLFFYVVKIIRKEKIDMLWAGEVLPTGTVIYCLAKWFKIPYVISCHGKDILQARKVGRKEKLARKIFSKAKYITVNSQYTAGLLKEIGVKDSVKVIYPGVDLNRGRESKYDFSGKPVLLSLGRLVDRKGVDRVIEALPQVWQEVPDLIYVIAGSGPYEDKLKKKVGDDKRVVFLGEVVGDDKYGLYDMCNVFIMPARVSKEDVEGFGIVYLEAAVAGKPAIAGKAGGAVEAVIDGETGILVNPESIDEIAKAVIQLFKDKGLREKLGKQAKERAMNEFNWQRSANKFKELL